MNKTSWEADIGLDYGLKFFTQLIGGGAKWLKHCASLRPLGTQFHFGYEFYVKCILSS